MQNLLPSVACNEVSLISLIKRDFGSQLTLGLGRPVQSNLDLGNPQFWQHTDLATFSFLVFRLIRLVEFWMNFAQISADYAIAKFAHTVVED